MSGGGMGWLGSWILGGYEDWVMHVLCIGSIVLCRRAGVYIGYCLSLSVHIL